jgi:hypothetical protein
MLTTFGDDSSVRSGTKTLRQALEEAFAVRPSVWQNTYASTSFQEYWATGAQIWHDAV